MKINMKKYEIIFADLDGTLIDTISGETFPKGIWDNVEELINDFEKQMEE